MGKESSLKKRSSGYGFSPDILSKLLDLKDQLKEREFAKQAEEHFKEIIKGKRRFRKGKSETEIVYFE